MPVDVIVVGASVAGSSLAGLLGRQGARVLLLDRASFPRPKPCGEGILPHGVKALSQMGALGSIAKLGREIRGLSYQIGRFQAQAVFSEDVGCALGIERLKLDQALLDWARESRTVVFEDRVTVEEPLMNGSRVTGVKARSFQRGSIYWEAPVTVFADGLHSMGRRSLKIKTVWPRRKRLATVSHLDRVFGMGDFVEVLMGDGFEVYLTPLADKTGVAILHGEKLFHTLGTGDRERNFFDFIKNINGLRDRVTHSKLAGAVRQWGPLSPWVEKVSGEGFVLTGDAAGAVDPLTGEGMSVALRLAGQMTPIILNAISQGGSAVSLSAIKEIHDREIKIASKLSNFLQMLAGYPWVAQRVVRNLSLKPDLFQDLFRVATGVSSYESFDWFKKLRLMGLLK